MNDPMHLPPEYDHTVFHTDTPSSEWPQAFAIITAHNPHGRNLPADANETLDQQLRSEMGRRGLPFFRMTGGDEGFVHSEPGWAITMDFHEAVEMGRAFHQLAIWWIEDGVIFLVECHNSERRELGLLKDRLR